MSNKALGWAIIIPIWFLALAGAMSYPIDSTASSILGLAILVFGTWGAYRLIKS